MIMQPQTGSFNDAIRRTVIAGMAGGTVSAITGGKFANGAVTSAIQWWFNAEDSPNKAFADERGSIELLLKGGKGNYAEAMLRTIKLYKIDMSHNGKVITPEIRLDLPSEDMVTTGKLFLGRGAFVNGAGYLGSTIQHEMVHVRFGSLYFDFQGDTLNRMEVEAYKHEIQNSNRFGLTYNQVIELKKLKNGYCSAISSSYRSEMGYSC